MQSLWQLVKDPDLREVIRRMEEETVALERRAAALEKRIAELEKQVKK